MQVVSHPESPSAGVFAGAHTGDGGLGWAPVGAAGGTPVSWPALPLRPLSALLLGTCLPPGPPGFAQLPGDSFIRNHYGLVALTGAPTSWKWGPLCA